VQVDRRDPPAFPLGFALLDRTEIGVSAGPEGGEGALVLGDSLVELVLAAAASAEEPDAVALGALADDLDVEPVDFGFGRAEFSVAERRRCSSPRPIPRRCACPGGRSRRWCWSSRWPG
jgi:hypothetical protein